MPLTIDVPQDLVESLRVGNPDLEREALEVFALDLFRREKVSLSFFGRMLGMNRSQAAAYLNERGETAQMPTLEELEQDYQNLKQWLAAEGR